MYKIRMKTGGNIYPVTKNLLKHSECEVHEVSADGTLGRVVDATEYANMSIEEMNTPNKSTTKPATKEAVTKKKPAPKKKKANKQKKSAIPDEPASLENIDVSAI